MITTFNAGGGGGKMEGRGVSLFLSSGTVYDIFKFMVNLILINDC